MNIKRKRFICAFINSLLILLCFILRFSGATLALGDAVPMILIPLVLSVAIFCSDNAALAAGFFAGVLMDSSSSETLIFNTLFFTLGAFACNLLSSRYLNRNLKSALCLSAGMSFGYYILKYLIYFVFSSVTAQHSYFSSYLIPSAIYTALWIIPFYFMQKKLNV